MSGLKRVSLKALSFLLFFQFVFSSRVLFSEESPLKNSDSPVSIGANIEGLSDWSRSFMFVDAMKTARHFGSVKAPWDESLSSLDADGWPTTDFGVVVMAGFGDSIHSPKIDGIYSLSFTGRAEVSGVASKFIIINRRYDPVTRQSTENVVVPPGTKIIALAFKNTGYGVRNIRLLRPGYSGKSQQTFTDEFLNLLKPFKVLRLMDYLSTNNNPVIDWAQRTKTRDALQTFKIPLIDPRTGAYPLNEKSKPIADCKQSDCKPYIFPKGGAIEYAIELANLTKKDLWVNIPLRASDAYVTELAQLLKDTLNADSHVYLEYSNEVWNWQFTQAHMNLVSAKEEVAAGDKTLDYDGCGNEGYWAWRRVAKRIVEISGIFRGIYGEEEMFTRIRPVLASQVASPFMIETQLRFIKKVYGSPGHFLYAIAGAPYFGLETKDRAKDNLTTDEIFSLLSDSLKKIKEYSEKYSAIAHSYGLKHIAYEGGLDMGQGKHSLEAKIAASYDPRMQDVLFRYLALWYGCGGKLFIYYNLASPYGQHGQWGLTENFLEHTVKMRAIDQLLSLPSSSFSCSEDGSKNTKKTE